MLTEKGRRWVDGLRLSGAIKLVLDTLLACMDALEREREPLERELRALAKADPRLRALQEIHGVGPILACHLLAEIGQATRFRRVRQVVRLTGLDPAVFESGETRRRGRLSKAGPPLLRWALVEAAQHASRPTSPDHTRYLALKARRGPQVARIAVARTLAARAYRALRTLEEAA
jgi:transposase